MMTSWAEGASVPVPLDPSLGSCFPTIGPWGQSLTPFLSLFICGLPALLLALLQPGCSGLLGQRRLTDPS